MIYRLLADVVVAVHFGFLVFVVAGAFLVRRFRWVLVPHLLCVSWGVYVEVMGALCPLTPLENRLARQAGEAGYQGSFIDHYLLPLIYPDGLTREMQWGLAVLAVAVNVVAYALVLRRLRGRRDAGRSPGR